MLLLDYFHGFYMIIMFYNIKNAVTCVTALEPDDAII